jgi:hypothetical protein
MINYLGSENFLNIWLNAFWGGKRAGPALALRSLVSERTLLFRRKFLFAQLLGFRVGGKKS